jgi:hypothetical protein
MPHPSSDRESDRLAANESVLARFERSLFIDYEQWHDGVGYDVEALDGATPFDSFTTTLEQVAAFHPQPVIDALWRGLETRQGEVAMHYAGMLAFLHGKTDSSFDWAQRPLFLEFKTEDATARRAAVRKLQTLVI